MELDSLKLGCAIVGFLAGMFLIGFGIYGFFASWLPHREFPVAAVVCSILVGVALAYISIKRFN